MPNDLSTESLYEQEVNFSKAMHRLHIILIGGLIGFLQLKYQPMEFSPFGTHFPATLAFFVIMFIYVILWVVEAKIQNGFPNQRRIIGNISHLFGALAAILLLFIAIPVFGILLLQLWAIWFIAAAYNLYKDLYHMLYTIDNSDENPNTDPPV